MVELVYNKLNFTLLKNTYKYFQEKEMPDILIRIMRLLEIRIILTQAKPIIIVDLNYNASSIKQMEKIIFCIE